jgi:hypothetical protein
MASSMRNCACPLRLEIFRASRGRRGFLWRTCRDRQDSTLAPVSLAHVPGGGRQAIGDVPGHWTALPTQYL